MMHRELVQKLTIMKYVNQLIKLLFLIIFFQINIKLIKNIILIKKKITNYYNKQLSMQQEKIFNAKMKVKWDFIKIQFLKNNLSQNP